MGSQRDRVAADEGPGWWLNSKVMPIPENNAGWLVRAPALALSQGWWWCCCLCAASNGFLLVHASRCQRFGASHFCFASRPVSLTGQKQNQQWLGYSEMPKRKRKEKICWRQGPSDAFGDLKGK